MLGNIGKFSLHKILWLFMAFNFVTGCVTDKRLIYAKNKSVSEIKFLPQPTLKLLYSHKNKHVRRISKELEKSGKRNFVLYAGRLALILFELKEFKLAQIILKKSTELVDTFYNEDVWAKKAQEVFTLEAIKDFKGDAYERSMLHYYAGLSYLALGETGNARAHLKNAFTQDSFAEMKRYRSDFFLMPLLESWILSCEGRSKEADTLISRINKDDEVIKTLNKLKPSPDRRNLIIIENGHAPLKFAGGKYLNVLRYGRMSKEDVKILGKEEHHKKLRLAADLHFQAASRGGRLVDAIIENKVQFRKDSTALRNVALGSSAISAGVAAQLMSEGDSDAAAAAAMVSAGFIVIGVMAELAAQSAATKADTRYWDNLPGNIHFLFPKKLRRNYVFKIGDTKFRRSVNPLYANKICSIGWIKIHNSHRIPTIAPNAHIFAN